MAYLRQNIWQKTNWIERCQLTLTCRIIGIFFLQILRPPWELQSHHKSSHYVLIHQIETPDCKSLDERRHLRKKLLTEKVLHVRSADNLLCQGRLLEVFWKTVSTVRVEKSVTSLNHTLIHKKDPLGCKSRDER